MPLRRKVTKTEKVWSKSGATNANMRCKWTRDKPPSIASRHGTKCHRIYFVFYFSDIGNLPSRRVSPHRLHLHWSGAQAEGLSWMRLRKNFFASAQSKPKVGTNDIVSLPWVIPCASWSPFNAHSLERKVQILGTFYIQLIPGIHQSR